ncbi:MAG: long-chain fatty acid--CoA ligase [Ignavibacteriales bacterium]|nr:long-chain fatty acid--CoA ligase [Ignavibacteriales bacterium]
MIIKEYKKAISRNGKKDIESIEFAEYKYQSTYGISVILAKDLKQILKKQKKAGIFIKDPVTTIFVALSLWENGITPALINPDLPLAEVLKSMQSIGVETVLTDYTVEGTQAGNVQIIDIKMMLLQSIMMQSFLEVSQPIIKNGPVILFTSGTTNEPKPVLLTAQNLISAYNAGNELLKYKKQESWLLSLPIYHIGGFSIFFRAYMAGQVLVIPPGLDSLSIVSAANQLKVKYISLVPTQLQRIFLAKPGFDYKPKAVLLGGAAPSESLLSSCIASKLPVYKVYGSTETAAFQCVLTPKILKKKLASSGLPLPGVTIIIKDSKGKEVPVGESGEICIRSGSTAKGYINNPIATKDRFKKGLFHTGDTGYLDDDGYLFVTGRLDDIINSGGEKIQPMQIYSALKPLLPAGDCRVFGLPDKDWGEAVSVILYGMPKPLKKELKQILEALTQQLPGFRMPKNFYFYKGDLSELLGKAGKKELQELVQTGKVVSLFYK